jgi:hypothetical protein
MLKEKNMNFANRASMYLGFVVLATVFIAVLTPKTTHAHVAALVQVSNTPSAAVPVVHAPAASNVYFASCEGFFSGGSVGSCTMPPTPADRTVVIEAALAVTALVSVNSGSPSGCKPSNSRQLPAYPL